MHKTKPSPLLGLTSEHLWKGGKSRMFDRPEMIPRSAHAHGGSGGVWGGGGVEGGSGGADGGGGGSEGGGVEGGAYGGVAGGRPGGAGGSEGGEGGVGGGDGGLTIAHILSMLTTALTSGRSSCQLAPSFTFQRACASSKPTFAPFGTYSAGTLNMLKPIFWRLGWIHASLICTVELAAPAVRVTATEKCWGTLGEYPAARSASTRIWSAKKTAWSAL